MQGSIAQQVEVAFNTRSNFRSMQLTYDRGGRVIQTKWSCSAIRFHQGNQASMRRSCDTVKRQISQHCATVGGYTFGRGLGNTRAAGEGLIEVTDCKLSWLRAKSFLNALCSLRTNRIQFDGRLCICHLGRHCAACDGVSRQTASVWISLQSCWDLLQKTQAVMVKFRIFFREASAWKILQTRHC